MPVSFDRCPNRGFGLKKTRFLGFWIFLMITATSGGLFAESGSDLIEFKKEGQINWTKYTITAKGIGSLPAKSKSNAHQIAFATAKRNALKKIHHLVQSIRIDSFSTLNAQFHRNDTILSEIENLVKNARITEQKYLSDGTVKVTMELPILGAFAQLALPLGIKQIESIKTIPPQKKETPIFTGLVVDATGIAAKPAMVFKIVDETGQEVYGPAFVNRDSAVRQGMIGYVTDLAVAQQNQRVTYYPLVLKGLKTYFKAPSKIVISNADASKLKSTSEHLDFLRKGRVMIVIDPPIQ
jgi:hypothetical protein